MRAANDVADAVRLIAAEPGAKFIAGGTNLLDLMKDNVETPYPADRHFAIAADQGRGNRRMAGLRIGALVPNSDLAWHPLIEQRYPLVGSAIFGRRLGAAAQHGVHRRQPAAADALRLFL